MPKGATPVFPPSALFLVPGLEPLLVFDGLDVFHHIRTKNTGYACAQSCYRLVTRPLGRLSNRFLDSYSEKERRLCELGGLESLLNPCAQLDTRLHPGLVPGLDLGVGFSLEYECNVTRVAAQ